MRVFENLDALAAAKGEHLGHGEWHEITQAEINLFADATGDHQWIHVDLEKAAAGPFGAPVAHVLDHRLRRAERDRDVQREVG